ncbi:MAG: hypothetical protein ACLQHF_03065 [Terracidiphilus sp.]
MLNDIGPWLARAKKGTAKGLLKRLGSDDPDQSIPAEYELALTWGVSQLASTEIEKEIGETRPDIYLEDFLPGGPMVADVKAISDVALSDEGVMMDARKIINEYCNGILGGAEEHLYYTFMEESGYLPADHSGKGGSRYFRRRKVTRPFEVDSAFSAALHNWLSAGPPKQKIRWRAKDIDVVIEWRSYVHPLSSAFCSMPSLAYDLKENYLYSVLKQKRDQLLGAPVCVQRAIFLGDAGCSLLRYLEQKSYSTISGQEIIQSFLDEPNNAVDLVAVFSPKRGREKSFEDASTSRVWHCCLFHRETVVTESTLDRFRTLTKTLPPPYLDGYQARSWHIQGMSNPGTRRDYLPLKWGCGPNHMTVRLSARSLQDLAAGRISHEELKQWATGDPNPFEQAREHGLSISAARFEPRGLDEDDDYVIFEFSRDPAISALKLPKSQKSSPS